MREKLGVSWLEFRARPDKKQNANLVGAQLPTLAAVFRFRCPTCRDEEFELSAPCGSCGKRFETRDGVIRALEPTPEIQQFTQEYLEVRHAEGRGSESPDYYWSLPFAELDGQLGWQWKMRAQTFRFFERRILKPIEAERKLNILDLGAGCGWLAYRMASRGHHAAAVDLLDDDLDGLGAARHYAEKLDSMFPAIQAGFDDLPFSDSQFDLVVYNASFHYAADYRETLREARRCLSWGGKVVILDSPIYSSWHHGERMVEERKLSFEQRYGFASDSLLSMEYLDTGMIGTLARDLNLSWKVHHPWYGLAWHMRPTIAKLKERRPPSKFKILVGSWAAS